jgi:hypothetical protein
MWLDLKQNSNFIKHVRAGSRFTLSNGDAVSPAYAGWSNNAGYTLSEQPAPEPVPQPVPYEPTPEELLAEEREQMICSPLQGKLTLGEAAWAAVEAWRDTYATWAQRQIIDSALDWRRNSQNMQFFAYLLGYTDEQMDDLFRAAMQVQA